LFWNNYDAANSKRAADFLSRYNLQGCSMISSIIDRELSDSLENSNKFLYAWTINDGDLALDLCQKYKIQGIFTDKPDVIRLSLAKLLQ
jgi:glycerophosphoryl diester phosphodiesterase